MLAVRALPVPEPHQAPWLQPGLMADPHGTGEVSRKALYWGLACEDTNLNHPFLYGPYTQMFPQH